VHDEKASPSSRHSNSTLGSESEKLKLALAELDAAGGFESMVGAGGAVPSTTTDGSSLVRVNDADALCRWVVHAYVPSAVCAVAWK
jgi:hypothetical protein